MVYTGGGQAVLIGRASTEQSGFQSKQGEGEDH